MISTDITGSSGGDASQVFSLLAVVADPEAYGAKLKALVAATEENKKYIALIAPASEIVSIRQQIASDKVAATTLLEDAKVEAAKLKADAQAQAKTMTAEATEIVAKAKKSAVDAQTAATAKLAEVDAVTNNLKTQLAAAAEAEKIAKAQAAASLEAGKLLEAEKALVISTKNKLIAKAKAFAEDVAK